MTLREIGWAIVLAGLPWSHLLFRPLDPWHGQALWWQLGVLAMTGVYLGRPAFSPVRNVPLMGLCWWWAGYALYVFMRPIYQHQGMPVGMLPYLLHLLLVVLAYHAMTQLLTWRIVPALGRVLAYLLVSLIAYGVLQLLNLDQLFKPGDGQGGPDRLVGTIGNPSHFAAQLTVLLPWLWAQPHHGLIFFQLAALLLLLLCHSSGAWLGYAAALGLWGWVSYPKYRRIGLALCAVLGLGFLWLYGDALNPRGRLEAWTHFFKLFQAQPLTGLGWGYVMEHSKLVPMGHPLFQWRHVHNEYFQLALETGLIGLGLFLWLGWQTVQRFRQAPRSRTALACACSLLALACNSLVNFPLHLAGIGAYGLFAYVGLCLATPEV